MIYKPLYTKPINNIEVTFPFLTATKFRPIFMTTEIQLH